MPLSTPSCYEWFKPLKFLFDTNTIIPAEPVNQSDIEATTPTVSNLLGLIAAAKFEVYIHPVSAQEIKRDCNQDRRNVRLQLLSKYERLPAPPNLSEKFGSTVSKPKADSHSEKDAIILSAVLSNAVDFLVTEDSGIHKWAIRLSIENRVLTAAEAIATVRGLLPQKVEPPPAVRFVYCHELNVKDAIFDTLRADYAGFDNWLAKCQRQHRRAFLVEESGGHSAIAIIKLEDSNNLGIPSPTLKICTFKVSDTARGYRYGELLLSAVFNYIHTKEISYAYLTTFSKQAGLIRFLEQFGFVEHPLHKGSEKIFLKSFKPEGSTALVLSPLEFHKRYGPYRFKLDGVKCLVVPIQPRWHEMLFPELEEQLNLFAGSKACGNSILKAYLCNASMKEIEPGSVLLFYRSQGASYIQAIGVVDRCMRSRSANEIAQFVGKRTVYSFQSIEEMCQKETLAILFRYAKSMSPIQLPRLVEEGVLTAAPQQICRVRVEGERWIKEMIER